MLPGGGTFCKKTSKDDVNHLFWLWKIRPVTAVLLAYLRVLAYHFGREIYARPGNSGCSVYKGRGVGLLLHACILITGRMHANSNTEA